MTLYKCSLFVILQCTSPRIAIDSRNLQVNGLKGSKTAEDILLYIFTSPTSIVTRLSESTDCKCNIASVWNFPKIFSACLNIQWTFLFSWPLYVIKTTCFRQFLRSATPCVISRLTWNFLVYLNHPQLVSALARTYM